MIPVEQNNILGTILPNVYINKITLETSGEVAKEFNPHVDHEREPDGRKVAHRRYGRRGGNLQHGARQHPAAGRRLSAGPGQPKPNDCAEAALSLRASGSCARDSAA